jgi:hypothetical protein
VIYDLKQSGTPGSTRDPALGYATYTPRR